MELYGQRVCAENDHCKGQHHEYRWLQESPLARFHILVLCSLLVSSAYCGFTECDLGRAGRLPCAGGSGPGVSHSSHCLQHCSLLGRGQDSGESSCSIYMSLVDSDLLIQQHISSTCYLTLYLKLE
jgi:hypothetical protein